MKVVSVKFKENGRAYYFDPGEFKIKEGDFVVVTTARGTECGEVVRAAHEVPGFSREVKPVIRVADAVDVRRMRQNRADVQQAYHICEQRIAAHNLKMKLVDAEYTLDRSKLVFYFRASLSPNPSSAIQARVRFLAYHRIKPHVPPLVRAPVNSFEFHRCRRTPQVGCLMLSLGR